MTAHLAPGSGRWEWSSRRWRTMGRTRECRSPAAGVWETTAGNPRRFLPTLVDRIGVAMNLRRLHGWRGKEPRAPHRIGGHGYDRPEARSGALELEDVVVRHAELQ